MSAPLDKYLEARPLLRHVRVMHEVMDVVDGDPKTRTLHAHLYRAFMDILNKELAPYALTLALAITEVEDAFPEIAAQVERGAEREVVHVQDEDTSLPELKIAPRVTRKHGETFAAEWFPTGWQGEDVWEAFAETGLMEWPDGELFDPRQTRYQKIEDEILERTFAAVRDAVAEAFTKAATEVLARERQK